MNSLHTKTASHNNNSYPKPIYKGRALRSIRRAFWITILAIGLFGFIAPELMQSTKSNISLAQTNTSSPVISVVHLNRPIDGVAERYLLREIQHAETINAALIIITLDTPGGVLDSTRKMVRAILESNIPIAVYVSPSGAHAASAGTFIAAAANILAMAPVTDIGAASPVGAQGEELGETLQTKATQDAAALLRSIAEQRKRNSKALEDTVLKATAYSENEAVQQGIADTIANDINELITWANGKTITTNTGNITLNLQNPQITERNFSILERALSFIANPNIAFLLISLGGLGLVVELWSIGTWIPGSIGVVLLIIGFSGAGQLPFQWAGVALIAVALALFALEILVAPGIGFFGIAGVIVLMLGGLFLFPSFSDPELGGVRFSVDIWLLALIGTLLLAFMLWLIREIRRTVKAKPYISPASSTQVIGMIGHAATAISPEGEVYLAGEKWTARLHQNATKQSVKSGDPVKVMEIEGITLLVTPTSTEANRQE